MNYRRMQLAGLTAAMMLAPIAWAQTEALAVPVPDKVIFFKALEDRGGVEVKPIKGAPYSADQTTVTTQTLADGNRIVQTSMAKVYRDEQGRSRVEQSLGSIGALASSEKHTMILIHDPVAGVRYNLQPENNTAEKIPDPQSGMAAKKQAEKFALERDKVLFSSSFSGETNTGLATIRLDHRIDSEGRAEELGVQTMEGLKVTGTRTTVTIPAGAEGNEQPMQIVDERWYSSDLQTNIKTVHTDPRAGQTVFTVTNVSRANPDASLFQVPAGYQTDMPLIRRSGPSSE